MNIFNNIVVSAIDDIFFVPSAKGRFFNMTGRVDYGLTFCQSGKITYEQNGKKVVSDRYHAVILPQGGFYTLSGDENGVFPLINFRTAFPFTEELIGVEIENPDRYIKEIEKMRDLYIQGENNAKVFSMFYGVLNNLANESNEKNLLAPAIKYLEENFADEDLDNSRLAGRLNISEVYFRRLFKQYYGVTPHKYLLNKRIEKAKQFLADRSLTVSVVAEKCGFGGVYHFCKAFKVQVGLTPSEYRRSLEKINL